MIWQFIPYAILVLTWLGIALIILWVHRRDTRTKANRADSINWHARVLRYMGTAQRQRSRLQGYLLTHTYFLTGNEEAAKQMADQTVRWMITLFMMGVGMGILVQSPVWSLIGSSLALWPLYSLKQRYYAEKQVFYRELITGGYIAFPHMLKAGVSLEEGIEQLAHTGSGSFQRAINEVCWLSGLLVRKEGQTIRLLAKPLTLIEALEEVSGKSDSKAFQQWTRRIKVALDKRISIADTLLEEGRRFLVDQNKKREKRKGKVSQRLMYIIDLGMPSLMTLFVMLELTGAIHYILALVGTALNRGGT